MLLENDDSNIRYTNVCIRLLNKMYFGEMRKVNEREGKKTF